jgi:hypothetical protein
VVLNLVLKAMSKSAGAAKSPIKVQSTQLETQPERTLNQF